MAPTVDFTLLREQLENATSPERFCSILLSFSLLNILNGLGLSALSTALTWAGFTAAEITEERFSARLMAFIAAVKDFGVTKGSLFALLQTVMADGGAAAPPWGMAMALWFVLKLLFRYFES